MTSTLAVVFALWTGTAGADARPSNDVGADLNKARDLVKKLADDRFKIRDAAEKELVHLGPASLVALKEGEKHNDLHVQERCRVLQPMIAAMSLQRRVDHFIANRDGPIPEDLPLATSFLKITGDTKEARELYTEILVNHIALLDETQRDKKKGMAAFSLYCQEINNSMRFVTDFTARQKTITRTQVALYFLMTTELAADKTGQLASYGYTFMNAPILPETLSKDTPAVQPLKMLFLAWIEKEPQPYMVSRGLQIAADAKMKETLPLVMKMVQSKTSPVYTRAQTALLLTKIGTKEHIKDIEPLLEDKTVVGNFGINNVQGQVQMRDVALAVCIKLSGQKMADYDFDVMKGNEDQLHMSYIYCAFSGDGKRNAAHKKYIDLKAKATTEKK